MTAVPSSLEIAASPTGIAISGEIDAHSVSAVRTALIGQAGQRVTVDLSGVDFVDSSGLRALIEMHQRYLTEDRDLVMTELSPSVRRLFEISGVTDYLNVDA